MKSHPSLVSTYGFPIFYVMEDETSIENINDIGKISNFLQNEAELLYLQVLVIVLLQYSQLFLKSMQ